MSNKRTMPNGTMFGLAAEELKAGRAVRISVMGRSMRPFFRSGQTIELKPIQPEALFVGSVIMARIAPERYAVHRILEIDGEHITMMGDGNIVGKERVHSTDIFGYVECTERHLRWARLWRRLLPLRRYLLAVDRVLCSLGHPQEHN